MSDATRPRLGTRRFFRSCPNHPGRLADQTAQFAELGVVLAVVNVPTPHDPEQVDMIGNIAATASYEAAPSRRENPTAQRAPVTRM